MALGNTSAESVRQGGKVLGGWSQDEIGLAGTGGTRVVGDDGRARDDVPVVAVRAISLL